MTPREPSTIITHANVLHGIFAVCFWYNPWVATRTGWEVSFEEEIARAKRGRVEGNEGMARVCARRAAGIAIGEYLARNNITGPGQSAYARLRFLEAHAAVPQPTREAARRLLLRITPDHTLPIEADLIQDARRIARDLLSTR